MCTAITCSEAEDVAKRMEMLLKKGSLSALLFMAACWNCLLSSVSTVCSRGGNCSIRRLYCTHIEFGWTQVQMMPGTNGWIPARIGMGQIKLQLAVQQGVTIRCTAIGRQS